MTAIIIVIALLLVALAVSRSQVKHLRTELAKASVERR